ncbi:hypothetical protein ACIQF6_28200 [Kitasatospora sp. NPDC092948]|uniref:hypothetical protein n=1 Tax=Kitasatospora sp. NPDC092948 TaxID=3364088 RepID=UPI0038021513
MTTDTGWRPLAECITPAAVLRLRAFLDQRALELVEASDFDSEPYRVAAALEFAIGYITEPLLADLELLADAHNDTTGLDRAIVQRWNELVVLAGRWEDQPGHDADGWQLLGPAPVLGADFGPTVLTRLRQGATWAEIAADLQMTTEQVRSVLREFADAMRERYDWHDSDAEGFPSEKYVAVLALLDLGDHESARPAGNRVLLTDLDGQASATGWDRR